MKKILKTICVFSLMTSGALAKDLCYTIDNPESIVILGHAKSGKTIDNKIEQAIKAAVKILQQPDNSKEASNLILTAKSKTMSFETFASDSENKNGYRHFQVDCDGGNVVATLHEGRLALFTERLNGDVSIAEEGCSTGQIAIMGAALLSETSCESLK